MSPEEQVRITLKAGVSTIEFCLSNELCFHEDEFIVTVKGRIEVPLCNITNNCEYHGQRVPDGRYVCDFLLREQNEKKVANYLLAGGQQDVQQEREC